MKFDPHKPRDPTLKCLSLCGTVSDIVLGILAAPFMVAFELISDVSELWALLWHRWTIDLRDDTSTEFILHSCKYVFMGIVSFVAYAVCTPAYILYYFFQHFKDIGTQPVYLEVRACVQLCLFLEIWLYLYTINVLFHIPCGVVHYKALFSSILIYPTISAAPQTSIHHTDIYYLLIYSSTLF